MEKRIETMTIRVTPTLKTEYDSLSITEKKVAKMLMLKALARHLWSVNHFDPSFYFGQEADMEEEQ